MSFDFDPQYLLWLLLPLAVLSGWVAARLDQRRQGKRPLDLPSAYFKGLNFLLNEQPDKAIEVFVQVLEVNSDTVETHLALGNLFRRRGEVERAIRVHQNLIARPMLDKDQRSLALMELGQDYLRAGLLDRAENIFLELAEIRAYSENALKHLRHIYSQEKDWTKAVAVTQKLARVSGKDLDGIVAQYYCELAELAWQKRNRDEARAYLLQALSQDKKCVRASLMLGDTAAAEGRHRDAIAAWQEIEDRDPRFLGEAAPRLAQSFRALNDEEGLYRYFREALDRRGGTALALTFAEVVRAREGTEAAETFITKWLRRKPNVHGLHQLIELNLEQAQGRARDDLQLLRGIIQTLRERHQGYACEQCGFRARTLHWQCPGCNRWSTVKPLVEE